MKVIPIAPVMKKFDPVTVSDQAQEVTDAVSLAKLKSIILAKQPAEDPTLRKRVADFTILKAYLMPGMTIEMLKTTPKLLYKSVPPKLVQPSGGSSPDVFRALTFVNGTRRPVNTGSQGNMWILNRPQGVARPDNVQPGNDSDVYAQSYNPLILCLVKVTKLV